MNNLFEESPLFSNKVECKKCGKEISKRGMRLHATACGYKKSSKRSNSPFKIDSVTYSKPKNSSFSSFFGSFVHIYTNFVDYLYRKMIENPMFFWVWVTLLLAAIIIPIWISTKLMGMMSTFFGLLVLMWKAILSICGFTMAFVEYGGKFVNKTQNTETTS